MINWINLRTNPPTKDCNICVKVGVDYETYKFQRYSDIGWELYKNLKAIGQDKIPENAMYINLDEICCI